MAKLVLLDMVESKNSQTVGWLVSLPVAVGLFGLMVWLAASLHWNVGAGILVFTFGAAAVGVVINRVVQQRLTLCWQHAVHDRVAEPTVLAARSPLYVGDSFEIAYQQRILQSLEIKHLSVQLVRRTRQVYHRNVMGVEEILERRREHVIQSHRLNGGHFQPEDTFQRSISLTIPDKEVPTLQVGNRYEEWVLRVRLAMSGRLACTGEYRLDVLASEASR